MSSRVRSSGKGRVWEWSENREYAKLLNWRGCVTEEEKGAI